MNLLSIVISAILYRLGGWKPFNWCKHNKLIRRIGIPILILFVLAPLNRNDIITAVLAFVALTLPLGDDETLTQNIISGLGLSLYGFMLEISWLNILPFIVYFFSLLASKKGLDWWICELFIGMAFIAPVLKF